MRLPFGHHESATSTVSPNLGPSACGMAIRRRPGIKRGPITFWYSKGRRPETKIMRFARHRIPGRERPLVSGAHGLWRDLSAVAFDITPKLLDGRLAGLDFETFPVVDSIDRFGPPLDSIGKSFVSV